VQPGDERDDLELVPAEGPALRGTVRDEQGRAQGNVHVSAFVEGEEGAQSATSARTGPDGSFEILGLAPGTYWIEASTFTGGEESDEPLLDALVEHVEAGGEPVTLVLPRGATIEGVLRDAHGAPVVGAFVQPRVESFDAGLVEDSTDVLGHFRLVVPRNSRWTIDVYPGPFGSVLEPALSEPGVPG
jgi:hypothetical protein